MAPLRRKSQLSEERPAAPRRRLADMLRALLHRLLIIRADFCALPLGVQFLCFYFAEFLESRFRFLLLAQLAVGLGQQIERIGIVWIERCGALQPVHAKIRLPELAQRLSSDVEISRRGWVSIGCFRRGG